MQARKSTGCYTLLLQKLGYALPKAHSVAIKVLNDPEMEVAQDAAPSISNSIEQ
ncbi:MAG TPA: hypothetical protein VGM27_32195 [Acidobacteriaceae bacterium]|jgi:hypothetical protein